MVVALLAVTVAKPAIPPHPLVHLAYLLNSESLIVLLLNVNAKLDILIIIILVNVFHVRMLKFIV